MPAGRFLLEFRKLQASRKVDRIGGESCAPGAPRAWDTMEDAARRGVLHGNSRLR